MRDIDRKNNCQIGLVLWYRDLVPYDSQVRKLAMINEFREARDMNRKKAKKNSQIVLVLWRPNAQRDLASMGSYKVIN